jgi:ribonucleotide monophosphatase NagD (HAD superfamily)
VVTSNLTGAGAMVAAVSCSVQKEPIVVGKPSGFLMDFLLKRFASCIMRKNIYIIYFPPKVHIFIL